MRASAIYPLLWIAWIAAFLAIELSALWSGHSNFTLSSYCWRLEQINRDGRSSGSSSPRSAYGCSVTSCSTGSVR